MATKSSSLRNSLADDMVSNIDSIEMKDSSGTVIATGSISGWTTASGGSVDFSSSVDVTGNSNAGGGTDIATARVFDSNTSGDEVSGITVSQDGSGDIDVENTNISDGQTLTLSSLEIIEPASTQ